MSETTDFFPVSLRSRREGGVLQFKVVVPPGKTSDTREISGVGTDTDAVSGPRGETGVVDDGNPDRERGPCGHLS